MSIRQGLKIVKKAKEDKQIKIRVEILKSGTFDFNEAKIKKYELKEFPFLKQLEMVKKHSNIILDEDDIVTDIEIIKY